MSRITAISTPVSRAIVGFLALLGLILGTIVATPAQAGATPVATVSAQASNDNIVTGASCHAGRTKVKFSANWDNVANDGSGDLDYVVINTGKKKLRKSASYWSAEGSVSGDDWVTTVNTRRKHVYRSDPDAPDVDWVTIYATLTNGKQCHVTLYTD